MEGPLKSTIAAVFLGLCVLTPGLVAAESGRTEAGVDSRQRYIVIPPLAGALSLELGLMGRFAFSDEIGEIPGLGVGGTLGYRSFFDDYGRLSLRTYGLVDRAGVGSSGTGDMWRFGGGAQVLFRGFTDDFIFGGWGIGTQAAFVRWDGLPNGSRNGWQASTHVELSVGQLFASSPFVFGETTTAIGFSFTDVDSRSGFSAELRWLVRFDWAFRRAKYE